MPAQGHGLVGWSVHVWHPDEDEELEGWYPGHIVSYSQHQEDQHVVMYQEDGQMSWEGWELPDTECIYRKRSPQCQIIVTSDMLPTAHELSE